MAVGAGTFRQFSEDVAERVSAMKGHVQTAVTDSTRAVREIDLALFHVHSIKGTAAVLGLHGVSRHAAELEHNLHASVASSLPIDADTGARIHRNLDAMLEAASLVIETEDAAPTTSASAPHLTRRRTILHIEDAEIVVELMQALLSDRADIDLRSAATARQGLDLARTVSPSLIFLDMQLPDASGQDVLASILANPTTSSIPVVVVSGEDCENTAGHLVDAGAVAYITKPFPSATVRQLVDRYCPAG